MLLLHILTITFITRIFLHWSYQKTRFLDSLGDHPVRGISPEEKLYLEEHYFGSFVIRFVRWMLIRYSLSMDYFMGIQFYEKQSNWFQNSLRR